MESFSRKRGSYVCSVRGVDVLGFGIGLSDDSLGIVVEFWVSWSLLESF